MNLRVSASRREVVRFFRPSDACPTPPHGEVNSPLRFLSSALAFSVCRVYTSSRLSRGRYPADGRPAKTPTCPPPASCQGKEETVNYNLLEEKWIPVLWKDGHSDRVGIIEALTEAGRVRQIAASNPMDRLAILRFLLALLYWCKGNPPDGQDSISSFPADWFKRLDEHRGCFNLLGDVKRFYQCNSKSGKEGKLSADYLMQEVPTGTNSWHFRHSTDKNDGLCAACCAMGLLRLPLFATSGGRGKPPGVNQKPPVYVVPVGVSLAETLDFSWRNVPDVDLGTPAWEEPDLSLPTHGDVPLLVGLTLLPRRVWLDNPQEPEANCISCGRKELLIRQCVFAGIGSTKTNEDGQGRVWSDPHTISDSKGVLKPSNALGAADAASGQWTKIAAGILGGKIARARDAFGSSAFRRCKMTSTWKRWNMKFLSRSRQMRKGSKDVLRESSDVRRKAGSSSPKSNPGGLPEDILKYHPRLPQFVHR